MAVMFIYTSWCPVPCPPFVALASAQGWKGKGICKEQKTFQPAGRRLWLLSHTVCGWDTAPSTAALAQPPPLCICPLPILVCPCFKWMPGVQKLLGCDIPEARLTPGVLSPAGTCAESLLWAPEFTLSLSPAHRNVLTWKLKYSLAR